MQLGMIKNCAGMTVSLNQKAQAFFGLGINEDGSKKIWLNSQNYWTSVPDDLTATEANMLLDAIKRGVLVEGKQYIPAADKDHTVLDKYWNMIKNSKQLKQEIKDAIINLVKRKSEGNYTALEILNYCLKQEESLRNNKTIVTFLKEGINAYDGPVQLVEDFHEDDYKVVVDLATKQVTPLDPNIQATKESKSPTIKAREQQLKRSKGTKEQAEKLFE